MAELTKEELLAKLAEKEAEIQRLQGSVQRLTAAGEGWLVTTPQPVFDGSVYGIHFINGQAFVRKDQHVPHFEIVPLKDTQLAKYGYSPEEQLRIREREKISTAERAVAALRDDLGYQVEYYDAQRLQELQTRIDQRVAQRSQAEAAMEAQRRAEGIMAPNLMGGR